MFDREKIVLQTELASMQTWPKKWKVGNVQEKFEKSKKVDTLTLDLTDTNYQQTCISWRIRRLSMDVTVP